MTKGEGRRQAHSNNRPKWMPWPDVRLATASISTKKIVSAQPVLQRRPNWLMQSSQSNVWLLCISQFGQNILDYLDDLEASALLREAGLGHQHQKMKQL